MEWEHHSQIHGFKSHTDWQWNIKLSMKIKATPKVWNYHQKINGYRERFMNLET
jgi:hypothetical protein